MPAAHRSAIREAVVQTTFQKLFRQTNEEWQAIFNANIELFGLASYDAAFAAALLRCLQAHLDDVRGVITRYASAWPWEQMHLLDRAVLVTAVAEMRYLPDVPHNVVISEYVEIAKNYGGDNSRKFVNGVLSSVYNELAATKSANA